MKALIRGTLILAVAAVLGLIVYMAALGSPLFRNISILFYRGLVLDGLLAILIVLAGLLSRWRGRHLDPVLALAAAAVSFSVNLSYLVVIPVTIDRSISVFLLATVANEEEPVSKTDLQRIFVDRYVMGMDQIQRRVSEQQASGNIVVRNGRIVLTPRGHAFVRFARSQSRLVGADPRFVGLPVEKRQAQTQGEQP